MKNKYVCLNEVMWLIAMKVSEAENEEHIDTT